MLPEHLLTFRAWLTRLQTATRNQQGTAKQRQMPELEAACASQLETLELVIREYERTVLRQEPLPEPWRPRTLLHLTTNGPDNLCGAIGGERIHEHYASWCIEHGTDDAAHLCQSCFVRR